jgi:hypothetical protein
MRGCIATQSVTVRRLGGRQHPSSLRSHVRRVMEGQGSRRERPPALLVDISAARGRWVNPASHDLEGRHVPRLSRQLGPVCPLISLIAFCLDSQATGWPNKRVQVL